MAREYCVPLENPKPDASRFIRCMRGQERCEKPPMIEYLVDPVVMRPIVTELLGRRWVTPAQGTGPQAGDRESQAAYWDNFIEFWYRMGYDVVRMELSLPFKVNRLLIQDAAPQSQGDRAWADEHQGTIMTWEDFEAYDWPSIVDVHTLSYADPDGVREVVRRVIEACAPTGRFAIGSGNSIPSYVPVENYLTMLDEALR